MFFKKTSRWNRKKKASYRINMQLIEGQVSACCCFLNKKTDRSNRIRIERARVRACSHLASFFTRKRCFFSKIKSCQRFGYK